ncbi:C40 family peptidase [Nocardia sp. 2]|uniref:C40 family peptidase n=1 Tax=Nocardia acididurans TaxID=2802282 RepID=A0ABS1MGH2_9NOCA|nr:NlpC/P60 family protein [Nocardia acididurans]MBL1079767.1 C40 family peptidase [Nocardia acididurans]
MTTFEILSETTDLHNGDPDTPEHPSPDAPASPQSNRPAPTPWQALRPLPADNPATSPAPAITPAAATIPPAAPPAAPPIPPAPLLTTTFGPSGTADPPPAAVPSSAGQVVPHAEPAPPPSTTAAPAPAPSPMPDLSQVDLARVADIVAPLASAAAMALPMISQALAGLAGGQNSADASGISPQAARALQTLAAIESLYGTTNAPAALTSTPSHTTAGTGSSKVLDAATRNAFYQRNAATAFSGLDTQLSNYLTELGRKNSAAAATLEQINADTMRQVKALRQNGLTKEGRRQLDLVLVRALRNAHAVVGDSQTTAREIAREVTKLADRYLNTMMQGPRPAEATSTRGQTAVDAALKQVGKGYWFAHSGPDYFDCSGLTKYAARKAGKNLPHNAEAQYQMTRRRRINPKDLRPGDLIFPTSAIKRNGQQGHVMMYIGNGKVVHSSGPREGGPHPNSKIEVKDLPKSYKATRWT